MAISPVNLNVDPRGYAGSLERNIPLYPGTYRPGGGRKGGRYGGMLQRMMALKEMQAQAELEMMRQSMAESKQGMKLREFERRMQGQRYTDSKARERQEQKERLCPE